jgi:hypothetical protein
MSTRIMITSKLNGNVIRYSGKFNQARRPTRRIPAESRTVAESGTGDLCGQPDMGGPA